MKALPTPTLDSIAGEFMQFVALPQGPMRTPAYSIVSRREQRELGQVRFYPRWRAFAFFPYNLTVYSSDCLLSIYRLVADENERRLMVGPEHVDQIRRLMRRAFGDSPAGSKRGYAWLRTHFHVGSVHELGTARRAGQVIRMLREVIQRGDARRPAMRPDGRAAR